MRLDPTSVQFNLSAVNWQSVSLLEGAHLDADRVYLEEMLRCSLFFSGRSGVVSLRETDLIPGSSSSQWIGVRLKRCLAVTPRGYLICWDGDDQPGEGVTGSVDSARAGETAPIYLCIDPEQEIAFAYPPQEIRNECSFQRPRFRLSTAVGEGELDAVKIGQFSRNPGNNNLQLDTDFIPDCLRLDSHWLLKRRIEEIQVLARSCLDSLVIQLQAGNFRLEPMAIPLASVAVLTDWSVSPYTYLEKMVASMRANFALQFLIQDTTIKARVYASLDQALRYIEPNLTTNQLEWAKALRKIEDTFRKLADAFPGGGPPARRSVLDDDIR